MKLKIRSLLFVLVSTVLLFSCAKSIPLPKIDRQPSSQSYNFINPDPTPPPPLDPNISDPFQIDFRSSDLTRLDLTQSLDGLLFSVFDSLTLWPPADKLPAGFDPQAILELGKDPGLSIRRLNQQGITGKGIGIAIIDLPLLVTHQEYSSRLKFYEEINISSDEGASMHGPAVASIAVGKTVGTAPQADLYFIATWPGSSDDAGNFTFDCIYLAQAVRRIIEINKSLPAANKIRVISMSAGSNPTKKGYSDLVSAIDEAGKAGIFVISMNISDTHNFYMYGLARNPRADPNNLNSYTSTPWWVTYFLRDFIENDVKYLLTPMDSRTFASPTGDEDYTFSSMGGMSWTAPYMAGVYAMACQVKPDITPQEFWETALVTGKTITIENEGKQYSYGVILDPQSLIEALK